jgi:hypothetical protein
VTAFNPDQARRDLDAFDWTRQSGDVNIAAAFAVYLRGALDALDAARESARFEREWKEREHKWVHELEDKLAAARGALDAAQKEIEHVRQVLPYGDTCGNCRGAARGPDGVPCPHCWGTGSEPDVSIAVEEHLVHFEAKLDAAQKRETAVCLYLREHCSPMIAAEVEGIFAGVFVPLGGSVGETTP